MSAPAIFAVDRLDLRFTPKPWPFALARRAEIDTFFAARQRETPALWNGRVLLMHRHSLEHGVFEGDYLETDYASFLAWRDWAPPDAGVHDCFGAGALVSADGAVLLGVMGAHTANAGQIYFPAGTPDPNDIVEGKVDLAFSIAREFKEETGIDVSELAVAPGWTVIADGQLVVAIRALRSSVNADALRARILGFLHTERKPELADIRIVRGPADFDPAMPGFVTAYLARFFAGGLASRPASA